MPVFRPEFRRVDNRNLQWLHTRELNVGIATGKGLLVIDIDPRRGGSLEKLAAIVPLPETATVSTGGGSWHLYFSYNPTLMLGSSNGRLGMGIDTKGEGSYVVAPPSIHASGKRYEWVHQRDIAPLPPELLALLSSPPQFPFQSASIPPPLAHARQTQHELVAQEGQGQLHTLLFWGNDLIRQRTAPDWCIPELLPEGVTLLTGRAGAGLSLLALNIALAIAGGTPTLGHFPTQQGKVVFLSLEESQSRIRSRILKLLQGRSMPRDFAWSGAWPPLHVQGLSMLETLLKEEPAIRLIVIDTLDALDTFHRLTQDRHTTMSSSSSEEYRLLTMMLHMLAQNYHSSIIVIHRLPEQGVPGSVQRQRTIVSYTSTTPCTLFLWREHNRPHALLYRTGRNVDEQELPLKFHPHTAQWVVSGHGKGQLSKGQQEILDALRLEGRPLSSKGIALLVKKDERTVQAMLKRMVEARDIKLLTRGLYTLPSDRVQTPETLEAIETIETADDELDWDKDTWL